MSICSVDSRGCSGEAAVLEHGILETGDDCGAVCLQSIISAAVCCFHFHCNFQLLSSFFSFRLVLGQVSYSVFIFSFSLLYLFLVSSASFSLFSPITLEKTEVGTTQLSLPVGS